MWGLPLGGVLTVARTPRPIPRGARRSEAGTYWSHHLQRDAHGHFLPAEHASGAEEQHPRDEQGRFVAKK